MSASGTTTKKNVKRFDEDVRATGSYAYTTDRLSAWLANARITAAISSVFPFAGKRVLDLGCGDGAYTVEFAARGIASICWRGTDQPSPGSRIVNRFRLLRPGQSIVRHERKTNG